jgi:hypothetical protein
MPLQSTDEEILQLAINELMCIVFYAKQIKISRNFLFQLVPKLSKLELMILDSAFKDMDLFKLRNTILVIPDQYIDMLQNVTDTLLTQLKKFISNPYIK